MAYLHESGKIFTSGLLSAGASQPQSPAPRNTRNWNSFLPVGKQQLYSKPFE